MRIQNLPRRRVKFQQSARVMPIGNDHEGADEQPPLGAVFSILGEHARLIDAALRDSLLADVRGESYTVNGESAALMRRADLVVLSQILEHLALRPDA